MFDTTWHDRLVDRFGDAVPAAEHLQIPTGLQSIVDELFDALADYTHAVSIYSVIDRGEGLVIIDARFTAAATAADKAACNTIIEDIQGKLSDV